MQKRQFDPWVGQISQRRKWQPTLVFLPGKSHRQRSLGGYSPWGCRVRHEVSDWTASVQFLEKLSQPHLVWNPCLFHGHSLFSSSETHLIFELFMFFSLNYLLISPSNYLPLCIETLLQLPQSSSWSILCDPNVCSEGFIKCVFWNITRLGCSG